MNINFFLHAKSQERYGLMARIGKICGKICMFNPSEIVPLVLVFQFLN